MLLRNRFADTVLHSAESKIGKRRKKLKAIRRVKSGILAGTAVVVAERNKTVEVCAIFLGVAVGGRFAAVENDEVVMDLGLFVSDGPSWPMVRILMDWARLARLIGLTKLDLY